jgi:hypothetical protein
LFKAEQEAISGNNYTYQRLLNETLILNQRYLRRARKLTAIGDDEKVDAEQRIEAHKFAAELERAAHDMSYMAPSYLGSQGLLLPEPKTIHPALTISKIEEQQQDPSERQRIEAAGEYRRRHLHQQRLEGEEHTDELDYPEEDEEDDDDGVTTQVKPSLSS